MATCIGAVVPDLSERRIVSDPHTVFPAGNNRFLKTAFHLSVQPVRITSYNVCYTKLLRIRYEDRIQFDVQINQEQQLQYKLPSLSLQPLIENITKHNIISEELPVYVAIYISQGRLVVKNTYQPRELSEPNTGIGIQNLAKRYVYITGKSIDTYIRITSYNVCYTKLLRQCKFIEFIPFVKMHFLFLSPGNCIRPM